MEESMVPIHIAILLPSFAASDTLGQGRSQTKYNLS